MLKNLHNFFNGHDIPWVHLIWEFYYNDRSLSSSSKKNGSFWWKDNLKLLDSFKGMAMTNVSDGATCMFWEDLWNFRVPRLHYPMLFSFARDPHISLKAAREAAGPDHLLHLPISSEALHQLTDQA